MSKHIMHNRKCIFYSVPADVKEWPPRDGPEDPSREQSREIDWSKCTCQGPVVCEHHDFNPKIMICRNCGISKRDAVLEEMGLKGGFPGISFETNPKLEVEE